MTYPDNAHSTGSSRNWRGLKVRHSSRSLITGIVFACAAANPFATSLAQPGGSDLDSLERGQQLLESGSYLAAVEALGSVRSDPWLQDATLGLARAHREVGQYERAERVLSIVIEESGGATLAAPIATRLAELYIETGRSAEALELLQELNDNSMPSVRALVRLGEVLALRGNPVAAREQFQQALGRYDAGSVYTSDEVAMVALAAWELGLFHDANALFDEAVRLDDQNLEALVLWGELFQQKFNDEDAQRNFNEALEVNRRYGPALRGLAEISAGERYLTRALDINPQDTMALTRFGALLIRNEQEAEGRRMLERALEINPELIPALATQAVLAVLQDDGQAFQQAEQQVTSFSPNNSEFYTLVAEQLGNRYRFTEAVSLARQALDNDPRNWHAHTVLGGNLIRLGEEEEGRQHLEQAFENDPFNVLTSNMLQVFDVMDEYATLETEHFRVRMSQHDATVLWPLMSTMLEDSWDRLVDKYGFEPEVPVTIQVFERTEDFAVRSVGLPDIGPLVGICFGKVITLISPDTLSANWQEILWHELVHVWTLQMTDNRMPRWLSEGISTWEEGQGQPEWGRRQGLDLVRAYEQGQLLPVGDLDAGFLGANSNADLSFAYFESYMVVDYIVERFGFETLRELILAYQDEHDENRIFSSVFDQDLEAFDADFQQWVTGRVESINVYVHMEDSPDEGTGHGHGVRENSSAVLAELYNNEALRDYMQSRVEEQPRDFQAHLQLGIVLFREQQYEQALEHLQQAQSILPTYSGYPSPSLVMAQIYEAMGNEEARLAQLRIMLENQQHDANTPLILANHALETNQLDQAKYYIDRALAVDPYQPEVQRRLADFASASDDSALAVQAFEVLMALEVSDPVGARTDLAAAYLANSQRDDAKNTVLRALEQAPSYERAQQILLQSVETTPTETMGDAQEETP